MTNRYSLSDTEREIMEELWKLPKGEYMKTARLFDIFLEKGKNWKRQTLNTLLIRLDEIGVIERRRSEVAASFGKEEYERRFSQGMLDSCYNGSLEKFLAALTGNVSLTDSEAGELNDLIDRLSKR